jgi:hypothetical protein
VRPGVSGAPRLCDLAGIEEGMRVRVGGLHLDRRRRVRRAADQSLSTGEIGKLPGMSIVQYTPQQHAERCGRQASTAWWSVGKALGPAHFGAYQTLSATPRTMRAANNPAQDQSQNAVILPRRLRPGSEDSRSSNIPHSGGPVGVFEDDHEPSGR